MEQRENPTIPDQQTDLLRVLYFTRIAKNFIDDLIIKNPDLPESLKNGTFRVIREITELERKIDNVTVRQYPWLKDKLGTGIMWDMSSIIDLMGRISSEESSEYYEQFLSTLVHTINAIFYMQVKRQAISFEKYRALLEMVVEEITLDVNTQPRQFICRDGNVYIKVAQVIENIKNT